VGCGGGAAGVGATLVVALSAVVVLAAWAGTRRWVFY
jgi:hypothetical protein